MALSHPAWKTMLSYQPDQASEQMLAWLEETWMCLGGALPPVEKQAWLSAGPFWLPEASATGRQAMFSVEQGKTEYANDQLV